MLTLIQWVHLSGPLHGMPNLLYRYVSKPTRPHKHIASPRVLLAETRTNGQFPKTKASPGLAQQLANEDQPQAWITVQSSAFESGSSRVGSRGRTEFGGRVTSSGLTATEMLWSSSASDIVLPARSSPKSSNTLVGWGFLLPNAYLALARSSLAIAILIDGHS
jgi:hypothetical protein